MLGKTRQPSSAEPNPADEPEAGRSRGVLGWPAGSLAFTVSRRLPSPALAGCIQHYWTVSWDLRGRPAHLQETLPHPNTYLVFEYGELAVFGVSTRKFTRLLEGKSRVFGVKFKPGGLRPFLQAPVSSLTDTTAPATQIFGADADALQAALLSVDEFDEMVEAANRFFDSRTPRPDPSIVLATQLVERIFNEPEMKTVDDLAARSGIGKRSLQRLFSEYVGVSPKWVIRRYRLHELVERLNSGEQLHWPNLALELGYFDQAHLINDFRSIVGYAPTHYRVRCAENSAPEQPPGGTPR